jgi:hypothetical protein
VGSRTGHLGRRLRSSGLDKDTTAVMAMVCVAAAELDGTCEISNRGSVPLTQAKCSSPLSQELSVRGRTAEVSRQMTRSLSVLFRPALADRNPHLPTYWLLPMGRLTR